jgi:uncharacterized protein (DUF433 family)
MRVARHRERAANECLTSWAIPFSEDNMWFDQYITRIEGVQGGQPVIVGTRTPVQTVAVLFHITYPGDRAEVARALGHLQPDQIDAALAYYDVHRAEIDAYIRENNLAFDALHIAG